MLQIRPIIFFFVLCFSGMSNFTFQANATEENFYGQNTISPSVTENIVTISLPGEARAEIKNEQTTYVLTDHLVSTRVITGPDNTLSKPTSYTPFGVSRGVANTNATGHYTNQTFEPETATYNYRARVYDPTVSRFISLDSAREDASPYVYVGNNPIFFVDLTGLGKLPFVMVSGINRGTLNHKQALARFHVESNGANLSKDKTMVHVAEKFFGSIISPKTGIPMKRKAYVRFSNLIGGPEEYDSKKLIWFVGNRDVIEEGEHYKLDMESIVPQLLDLRKMTKEKDLATEIEIIDLTEGKPIYWDIRQKLESLNGPLETVEELTVSPSTSNEALVPLTPSEQEEMLDILLNSDTIQTILQKWDSVSTQSDGVVSPELSHSPVNRSTSPGPAPYSVPSERQPQSLGWSGQIDPQVMDIIKELEINITSPKPSVLKEF